MRASVADQRGDVSGDACRRQRAKPIVPSRSLSKTKQVPMTHSMRTAPSHSLPRARGRGRVEALGSAMTSCAGSSRIATGISTQSASADVHTICPNAADCRRSASENKPPAMTTRLVLNTTPVAVTRSIISASLLASVLDQCTDLVQLHLRQLLAMHRAEEGGRGAHGGAFEKILDDASQCSGARLAARDDRRVHVARAVRTMQQMLLVHQDPQQGADRGVTRRICDLLKDLRRRG